MTFYEDMKKRNLNVYVLVLISALCLGSVSRTFAQDDEYERGQKLMYLDLGIQQYESGNYEEADKSFREVLESVKVLPAEICYYVGVNSFYLEKYKQSINWLNKYMALKGTSGQFFDNCTKYLEKAEENYLLASGEKEQEVFDPGEEVDYTVMPEVDCGPTGKVVCPVCKGQTVIIKKSAMSLAYKSCPYCDNHGNLSCDNYNLLLKGELKPKSERASN